MLALAGPEPGEHVLDVACGAGAATSRVAQRVGPGGFVLGTDISDAMVGEARSLAAGWGHREFRRMSADRLDLPDAAFDVALCAFGLMYVPEPGAALAEMRRVLRPGGRMAAAVWGSRGRCGWAEVFPIVDARVQSEVCPLFFQLGTGDTLAIAMAAAGFGDIRVERLSAKLRYASADAALTAAFAAGPVALAYSRFDVTAKASVHAEYLASIAPYRAAGGYEIPAEFVVAAAVR